jgi:hypothetical protein
MRQFRKNRPASLVYQGTANLRRRCYSEGRLCGEEPCEISSPGRMNRIPAPWPISKGQSIKRDGNWTTSAQMCRKAARKCFVDFCCPFHDVEGSEIYRSNGRENRKGCPRHAGRIKEVAEMYIQAFFRQPPPLYPGESQRYRRPVRSFDEQSFTGTYRRKWKQQRKNRRCPGVVSVRTAKIGRGIGCRDRSGRGGLPPM